MVSVARRGIAIPGDDWSTLRISSARGPWRRYPEPADVALGDRKWAAHQPLAVSPITAAASGSSMPSTSARLPRSASSASGWSTRAKSALGRGSIQCACFNGLKIQSGRPICLRISYMGSVRSRRAGVQCGWNGTSQGASSTLSHSKATRRLATFHGPPRRSKRSM